MRRGFPAARAAVAPVPGEGVIPSGGVEIIQEQINRITAKGDARLSLAFAFSLGLALWSANAGMKAVIDALNVTYQLLDLTPKGRDEDNLPWPVAWLRRNDSYDQG